MIFRKGHIYKSLLYFKTGEKPALIMTSCGMISTFFCFFVFNIQPAANHSIHVNGSSRKQHCSLNLLRGMDDIWSISVVFWVVFFISLSEEYRTQVIQFVIVNLSLQGNEISVCVYFFSFLLFTHVNTFLWKAWLKITVFS